METDWKLFRSRIDMITLDTADDAINMADILYNTMVHTDSNIIPLGNGIQTLGNAANPWDSLFTSTINTGTDPLTIQNDLDVIGNADIGNQLNVDGNAGFLSNVSIGNGGHFTMVNGHFTILNGNINIHNGILTVNSGIVVNNGGVNILHGGMNIVDGVYMQNTLTVNNGISLTNGTFDVSLCPVNAHAGLNVQNGIVTDRIFINGNTSGGLYPVFNVTSSPYSISNASLSFSDNIFLINDNTKNYIITLPILGASQYGAHLTVGTMIQLSGKSYTINTQGAHIFGTLAGVVNGGVNIYSDSGYMVNNPNHGESQELIFTSSGWFVRGFVADGTTVNGAL
jgi:hypothetical protein